MRTFRVITSQNQAYYERIGKDSILSFLEYWPKNITMELWAEGFIPDIEDDRLIIKDFFKVQPRLQNFLTLIEPHIKASPSPRVWKKFQSFWLKGHVTLTALEEFEQDIFIWLDSDVITHKTIPLEYLENLIPEDVLSVDVPAAGKVKGKEAETGFLMLNMKHPLKDVVINYYRTCHTTTKIMNVSRYLETGVWWNGVTKAEKLGAKVKHLKINVDSIVPFMSTELAEYLRHWVTKKNKGMYVAGERSKTMEEL
jgi:hypothetical protein